MRNLMKFVTLTHPITKCSRLFEWRYAKTQDILREKKIQIFTCSFLIGKDLKIIEYVMSSKITFFFA